MEITPKEAQELLRETDSVAKEMRAKRAYGVVGPILVAWGAVWIVCFGITHFVPTISGTAWLVGDAFGIAASIYVGHRKARCGEVQSEASKQLGWRLFWFWLFLFIYADIWLAVLRPSRGEDIGLFIVTLVMFAYVVMGLWLGMRFLLWLGLLGTLLAVAGYVFSMAVPGYLDLWLGLTSGTALFGSGIYLTLRWR